MIQVAAIRKIFPEARVNFEQTNIDALVRTSCPGWHHTMGHKITQDIISQYHAKNSCITYGGWMENRSFLFRGTYMDETSKYVHLGVDINFSQGTVCSVPANSRVIDILVDEDIDVGWGTRVIIKPDQQGSSYLVFAHLKKDIPYKQGDLVAKGSFLGIIGDISENGNVFEHLHVQAVDQRYFESFKDLEWLDGYASTDESGLMRKFPHPLVEIASLIK